MPEDLSAIVESANPVLVTTGGIPGDLLLAAHGVNADDATRHIQQLEQLRYGGDLIGFGIVPDPAPGSFLRPRR